MSPVTQARQTTGARRRATLREVAALAGVSPTTASLVLNGRPIRVPDATRARVVAAAAELHYVPNALVRSLQAGHTGTVGVYIEFRASVWHNAFVGALVDGLRRGAADADSDVLLYRPPGGRDPSGPSNTSAGAAPAVPSVAAGASAILDGRADAAVLWVANDQPLEALARQGFPAVVLMNDRVPASLGSVLTDERMASRLLLDHLLQLGHRHLAYWAASGATLSPHLRIRRARFLAVAREVGVPLPAERVLAGPPAEAANLLLRQTAAGAPGHVTAIVCAFEELAYRLLDAAARAGLRVPQDLSIVSWEVVGGEGEAAHGTGNSGDPAPSDRATSRPGSWFTGVHLPIWEMGKAAAELAVAMSHKRIPSGARRQTFPTSLQIGRSTGPCHGSVGDEGESGTW
ncbi:MAG: LacI family DNA-binding transcriptional regulator [Chloroflexota bacterium]